MKDGFRAEIHERHGHSQPVPPVLPKNQGSLYIGWQGRENEGRTDFIIGDQINRLKKYCVTGGARTPS